MKLTNVRYFSSVLDLEDSKTRMHNFSKFNLTLENYLKLSNINFFPDKFRSGYYDFNDRNSFNLKNAIYFFHRAYLENESLKYYLLLGSIPAIVSSQYIQYTVPKADFVIKEFCYKDFSHE